MFYDAVQKKFSRLGEKCHKIVVETRPKTYTKMMRDLETKQISIVEIGQGTEIVSEIWTTEAGVKIWEAAHPVAPPAEEKENG